MRVNFWHPPLFSRPPAIKVSRFLETGLFVPSWVFISAALAFVPPGALPQATAAHPAWWVWGLVLVLAGLLCVAMMKAPLHLPAAYALCALQPLVFASRANALALVVHGSLAIAAGLVSPKVWLVGALLAQLHPLLGACAACSAKICLDAHALRSGPEGYSQLRRWGTLGSVVHVLLWSQEGGGVPVQAAGLLVVGAFAGIMPRVREEDTGPPAVPPSTWMPLLVVGAGRGCLLPHVLAGQLVGGGFPPHVCGIFALIAAATEFAFLSFGSPCIAHPRKYLAFGLIGTGVHLQVVCAVSGGNWLWVLPLSAVAGGLAAGMLAMAVPLLAREHGGIGAQGLLQGIELFSTAAAVLAWPSVVEGAGATFAYQLAADLVIVVGVLVFLQSPRGQGEKSEDVTGS